jgi:hypothetical protein
LKPHLRPHPFAGVNPESQLGKFLASRYDPNCRPWTKMAAAERKENKLMELFTSDGVNKNDAKWIIEQYGP